MSYLKFDKNLLINLDQSLKLEVLRTNKSGAYHCTSVVDCNTRKYHGLLVMPVPELDDDNHVLLSSLHETVIQHGAEFNLGINKYDGDNFSPRGHKYIREFDFESVPKTVYRVGGVVLSKEKLFVSHENRVLIKYTLIDAHSPTILRFKPFLAFRNVNILTYENDHYLRDYTNIDNGIATKLYPSYPLLNMQFNKPISFNFNPVWHKGIEYIKEMERGYDYKEDLYTPGYFELPIKKGESVYFSAGDTPISPRSIKRLYEKEWKNRTFRNSFTNCLINSAQQFHHKVGNDLYLLAGYPWFKVRARDMFIALPGCTLSMGCQDSFEKIMATGIKALKGFMERGEHDTIIKEIEKPDTLLWALWAIQQFAKDISEEECIAKYGHFIDEAVDYIAKSSHPNLKHESNGLLYSDGTKGPISWMNSTLNGLSIVPRTGYLVEFNALWYNILMFSANLSEKKGNKDRAEKLFAKAQRTGESFRATFMNEHGYLFDYVHRYPRDYSVRPNMVFAVSLHYSPLERPERKRILDYITKELVTPKGLRTLSPKSEGYNPYCEGNFLQRDQAYHQGTAWPWLFGPYLEAYLKIFGQSGVMFVERMLIGFDEEMANHCIGTIAELFDGNPPYQARGAISYAMNVASILRIKKLLATYL